ncbi:MAG TPA: DNA-protecting protein DprA [Halothiobacillaceae bacterium]|nr:DNA-protecting protein DprA [Halothiobacillaceae bacterium]
MTAIAEQDLALSELLAIPGMGQRRIDRLLTHFSCPADALGARRSLWREAGVPESICRAKADTNRQQKLLDWLARHPQHQFITINDPRYPASLSALEDRPGVLFAAGDAGLLNEPQLAIVGSRTPTASGAQDAYAFARYLAQAGLVITSGLAYGIDARAHAGALDAPGATIGILGSGIDRIYPAENLPLAERIQTEGGLIISEWPPGTEPRRGHFPRRNRLISGLSTGVLVIEASRQSGSLITARLAAEQNREVFALPGSIHNPLARGPHQLIREGAKLVEQASDIFEELAGYLNQWLSTPPVQNQDSSAAPPSDTDSNSLDAEQQQILALLGHDPRPADWLIEQSGLTAAAVSSILLMLELQGLVATLPGGLYQRTS